MPLLDKVWRETIRASPPPRAGIAEQGSGGGGYAPMLPAFTLAQIQDMAAACLRARSTMATAPLDAPFTYQGQDSMGLRTGDHIAHMLPSFQLDTHGHMGCVTDAEAARQCAQDPTREFCGQLAAAKPVPKWAYAAGAAAALGLLYLVTR